MASFEEEVRKLRRSFRTVDLEVHISGFSGTHSILQHIKRDILTSLWHSLFFFSDFNMHTEKHFYKNVVFSLCSILVSKSSKK